jgi:hypothetical protein
VVLGDSVYINREEKEISMDECEGIWISHVIKGSGVPNCDASCIISMPLSTEPLNSFLFTVAETFKHNFLPALIVMGSTAMVLHYQQFIESCDIVQFLWHMALVVQEKQQRLNVGRHC